MLAREVKRLRKALDRLEWYAGYFKPGPTLGGPDLELAQEAREGLDRVEGYLEASIPADQGRLF